MCGRYYNRRQKQEIATRVRADKVFEEPYVPDFNIAPTTFQPVLRLDRDGSERELALMRWGLLPFFAKSLADFKGFSTLNARAEGITSSATWRGPLKSRRCIIPADGFYEWKRTPIDVATANKMRRGGQRPQKELKVPYAITLRNGEVMAFAGLWDAWKEPKPKNVSVHTPDRWLQSFTIITTEANQLMASIHTRMPVILRQRDWAEWLDRDGEKPPPVHLLRPYDSDEMQTASCNPAVGNVKNNGPEMLVCPTSETLPLNSL